MSTPEKLSAPDAHLAVWDVYATLRKPYLSSDTPPADVVEKSGREALRLLMREDLDLPRAVAQLSELGAMVAEEVAKRPALESRLNKSPLWAQALAVHRRPGSPGSAAARL